MNTLGMILEQGKAGPPNREEARRLYRMSADRGDDRGMVNLAYLYWHDSPRQTTQAIFWYRKAAGKGNQAAIRFLESKRIPLNELSA